ncbi:MAG: aminotransferase class I/II-fold pyridoxal phosphate-dependent enzyme [Methylococcaceae bacterium]|nr:MAG: aminotransferase class I/II-fold pyridoxal phosphate-dependent enzyme [Methylococcaceae bacterium]
MRVDHLAERLHSITPFYVMAILRRAKELEALGHSIIHMEIGEPDFPTPPLIIEAGIACLQSGQVKYTPAAGLPALRRNIAEFYQQRYAVTVAPERVFVTPGASGALLLALGLTLNPKDTVLMTDPCYPCNANFVSLLNANAFAMPVTAATHYQLTPELIDDCWHPGVKGVLMASPSNPTGTIIPPQQFQHCIDAVQRNGGYFYSDEIYHGLVYGSAAMTALTWSDQVFVLNSFSKYFGMTGWRVGWLIVPEAFIEAAEKLAQNIFIAAPTHSQVAALAAFEPATIAELEARRRQCSERLDYLYDGLCRLGFTVPIKPEGAFYVYANCAAFTDNSYQFALDLLETEGVAITPGIDFGRYRANEMVRFAYTLPIDAMREALVRIERFITRGH